MESAPYPLQLYGYHDISFIMDEKVGTACKTIWFFSGRRNLVLEQKDGGYRSYLMEDGGPFTYLQEDHVGSPRIWS